MATRLATPSRGAGAAAPRGRTRPARPWWRRWHWFAYLYLLPAFAFYGGFVLRPLLDTAWISLFDWNGITAATWVGIDNYLNVLADPAIRQALTHSAVFLFFYAALPVGIGLTLAGLMVRIRVRGLSFFRVVLFVPQVLSSVVVAISWRWIYDLQGPLNAGLEAIGLGGFARAWLGDFDTALPSVGLIGSWVMYGLCMVLFIAGVQKIPREQFEAARIDGCGPIREFFSVTLPALRGELMVALVLTITFALRNFDIVWNTTSGGPGSATTVPSVFIYRGAFLEHDVGRAAAISVLLCALILSGVGLVIRLLRDREA